MDTIFALASARGKSGVAVIRLSGSRAWDAVASFGVALPAPRRAALRTLRDEAGSPLDEALVLLFEAGSSFTGEEMAELQVHGAQATVAAVLGELGRRSGCRLAEPGEFTRRALENGRLDLAQVEGLADLIDAETEAQRRQALRILSGALGAKAEGWRKRLVRAAALLEATIDFADEDVPEEVTPEVLSLISDVVAELELEIAGAAVSERIREGFEVAIVGAPNAGKSTLLNALAGREAAITSAVAGTTRDVIEVRMDLRGLPVTLLDTAGLRSAEDEVEWIGVARARERAQAADLRVFLLGGDGDPVGLEVRPGDITAHGKADIGVASSGLSVSGITRQGIDDLVEAITIELERRATRAATATRFRHADAMGRAERALKAARADLEAGRAAEFVAEEIRVALRALESLMGRVDVENLLDEIFASFCIGK